MNYLNQKKILLGMTGGIAAYKCAELTRRLKDLGADVRVVMTQGAKAFITPLTMQAVSGNPVSDSLLDPAAEAAMGHIELAKWADVVIVAPASANTIACLANGLAGDLLSTLCLATPAPIVVCPAMNQQMWAAKATQRNMATLIDDGKQVLGPASGEQACGDVGVGRMSEPLDIIAGLQGILAPKPLAGKKLVITAGPTQEAIDPVRYISNHSSGKMGYAIAAAAQQLGCRVELVSGPCNLPSPYGVNRHSVVSAQQMLDTSLSLVNNADIFIGCAAVADYRAADQAQHKIKKSQATMTIELTRNPDVLASVAALDKRPFTVGFAAETQDIEKYALDKMQRKNLDMIAANNVALTGQGFGADQNALQVFWPQGKQTLELADKTALATKLMLLIAEHINKK
ncbi:bifunctional phosphopantothenoylcysteine decarboxylase/phosphopantothenate--cysteine ligase CoaBC [Saccharobesus litoralis]|uniref:Coenzyme A biosynthesis bifunctional protein CoaBC n=1 Tax=Saccharobesus litoralis TaxID=2172099 RepID=A0A2S0VRT1_9ALTE|nr:bifunctional phosphopantothenoylcysteine decarboxylase/phosphopantothenate--cysteine ligase CoaBC [Saccharobesus litoralis]AWB66914.1 bifunctional phosphopantothenoylcysteine decarboxylase/phosphopantothenate--cysteine ligase CoaBC [Saccharobesus litoralis]